MWFVWTSFPALFVDYIYVLEFSLVDLIVSRVVIGCT